MVISAYHLYPAHWYLYSPSVQFSSDAQLTPMAKTEVRVFKGTAGGSAHWFGVSGIRRLEPGYSSSLPFHLDLSEGEL